jgi:hypothetical protein
MQELNPVHIKFLNMVCTKVCNFKYVIINTGMKEKNERRRRPSERATAKQARAAASAQRSRQQRAAGAHQPH